MILTDSHTHLYSEAFDEDREEVIQRAVNQGVERFFLPAIDSESIQAMQDLKQAHSEKMYLMAGLHPTHVKEDFQTELDIVKDQLKQGGYVAVGETGMDLYWDTTFRTEQEEAFRTQIDLALEYELPIVIHCRKAFDEVFNILEDYRDTALYGIFHCFTGNHQQALQAVDLNFKLGIGGVVTFKNGGLDKFLSEIPLQNIVLETDAPYLAPAPYRGKRNEPAYTRLVAEKVAALYDMPLEEIAEVTTGNTQAVFGV